jgi:3-deoxy-manno-octulosonate cytidylyltransferase (CMP-KDO synthetase)
MKTVIIIPARLDSSRFPRKVLAEIGDKSMIQLVYENCLKSNADGVYVACDSLEIAENVKLINGNVYISKKNHLNGTSRIAELALTMDAEYIINVQADEPLLSKNSINKLIETLNSSKCNVATLISKIKDNDEIYNPNVVKVIIDKLDNAIYFSRSCIPYNRMKNEVKYFKHIGVYAYKKDFLFKYINLDQGDLENCESLEQLRILENGFKIKTVEIEDNLIGVDDYEDLLKVREILENVKV